MPFPIPEPDASGKTTSTPVPLYWVRYGDIERPPLIALHGGPGADHRYLLPQLLHLAERYSLILYDQRGSGQSRVNDNTPITWHDHVADLASVAKEFGIERPALLGYSWGGMLSMLYSIQALDDASLPTPQLLALMSPAPVTKAYRAIFDENLRTRGTTPELTEARQALTTSDLRERDPGAYQQRLFELGVSGYFYYTANASQLTPFRVVGRVQQSTWESLGDFNLLPDLARIENERPLPAYIVHGRNDPIPVQSSLDAAHALGARVSLLDDCGHVPYVEQPEALWAALDPFLEEHL